MIYAIINLFNLCFGTTDDFLTKDLNQFAPRVYGVMETVNGSLQAIGYALLVILTLWNVVHSTTTLAELKRPSVFLKVALRFMLTKYIVGYGWTIVNEVFSWFASLTSYIFDKSGFVAGDKWHLPAPGMNVTDWLQTALDSVKRIVNPLSSVPSLLLSIIAFIVALVLAVTLILTVMGRFFKIYLMAALSPIPLSMFGSEATHDVGRSFIRGFFAVSLEGLVIGLAMIVFGAYLADPINIFSNTASITLFGHEIAIEVTEVFSWLSTGGNDIQNCFSAIFNMLLFLGIIKGSDQVIQRVFGV